MEKECSSPVADGVDGEFKDKLEANMLGSGKIIVVFEQDTTSSTSLINTL